MGLSLVLSYLDASLRRNYETTWKFYFDDINNTLHTNTNWPDYTGLVSSIYGVSWMWWRL